MSEEILNNEEVKQLADAMTKKHQSFLDERHFDITYKKTENSVLVTVTLRNSDDSFFYPVELRMNFEEEELLPRKAILHLIDYADLYYEDYLTEGENLLLPIDWCKHEYDTVDFEMRGQVLNKKLENMADEILARAEENA